MKAILLRKRKEEMERDRREEKKRKGGEGIEEGKRFAGPMSNCFLRACREHSPNSRHLRSCSDDTITTTAATTS